MPITVDFYRVRWQSEGQATLEFQKKEAETVSHSFPIPPLQINSHRYHSELSLL